MKKIDEIIKIISENSITNEEFTEHLPVLLNPHNLLSPENFDKTRKALQQNTSITKFNLDMIWFMGYPGTDADPDAGIKKRRLEVDRFAILLEENNRITELNLGFCRLGSINMKRISQALMGNSTLKVLNLEYNNLQDEGAEYLSTMLKGNTSITSLNLNNNSMSYKGIKTLIDVIKQHPAIRKLGLGNILGYKPEWGSGPNNIFEHYAEITQIAKDIAILFSSNHLITDIDLSDNWFTPDAVEDISAALRTKNQLVHFNFSYNDENSFETLLFALRCHSNLKTLIIQSNEMEEGGLYYFVNLENCKELSSLHIAFSHLTNLSLIPQILQQHPRLVEITNNGNPLVKKEVTKDTLILTGSIIKKVAGKSFFEINKRKNILKTIESLLNKNKRFVTFERDLVFNEFTTCGFASGLRAIVYSYLGFEETAEIENDWLNNWPLRKIIARELDNVGVKNQLNNLISNNGNYNKDNKDNKDNNDNSDNKKDLKTSCDNQQKYAPREIIFSYLGLEDVDDSFLVSKESRSCVRIGEIIDFGADQELDEYTAKKQCTNTVRI